MRNVHFYKRVLFGLCIIILMQCTLLIVQYKTIKQCLMALERDQQVISEYNEYLQVTISKMDDVSTGLQEVLVGDSTGTR